MKKWLIYLIILICIPSVFATECEISEDNLTFVTVTSSVYGGYVDEAAGVAHCQNLEADTWYYYRCRENATASWIYSSAKTLPGGFEEMELAMIAGIGVIAFFLLYLAINLKEEKHFILKLLFIFLGIATLMTIPTALVNAEEGSTGIILTKLTSNIMITFSIYIVVFLFYNWAKDSEKFANGLNKMGFKKIGGGRFGEN